MSITDLNEALDKAERGILNFFLPRRCPFCGAVTGKELLCDKCEKSLPYTRREGGGGGGLCPVRRAPLL